MLKMEYQCLDCPLTLFKSAIDAHEKTFDHTVSRIGKLVEQRPSNLLTQTLDELNAHPPKTARVFNRLSDWDYPKTRALLSFMRRHYVESNHRP